jgi:hypothetical protein
MQSGSALAAEIDLKEFLDSLQRGNVDAFSFRSIEDFVSRLPSNVQSSAVVVYNTIGAQTGSQEFPRIERIDTQNRLVLTVGTNPAKSGFNTVEISHYPADGSTPLRALVKIEGGHASVGLNPPDCMKCHANGKLVWTSDPVHPFQIGRRKGKLSYITKADEAKLLKAIREKHSTNPRLAGVTLRQEVLTQNLENFESAVFRWHYQQQLTAAAQLPKGQELRRLFIKLFGSKEGLSDSEILKAARAEGFAISPQDLQKHKKTLVDSLDISGSPAAKLSIKAPFKSTAGKGTVSVEESKSSAIAAMDLALKSQGHSGLSSFGTNLFRASYGFSGSEALFRSVLDAGREMEKGLPCPHPLERLGRRL